MGVRASAVQQTTDNGAVDRKFTLIEHKSWEMLEFFAGSGLVSLGLQKFFSPVWANDICTKKAAIYQANHKGKNFILDDINNIKGADLPQAHMAWASFPCQDLSLAGATEGINARRSGLVWQWLRIIDEMPVKPRVLVAENVTGLVSLKGGKHYLALHKALHERGYQVGAVVLDAVNFIPQSRPRVFVIAVEQEVEISDELIDNKPNWLHTPAILKVAKDLLGWVWWKVPEPQQRDINLIDFVEWDAPTDPEKVVNRNLELMAPRHREYLMSLPDNVPIVATGYKRTRQGQQVLELRFDGNAGCLRTPDGGSSRQLLIMKRNGEIRTRLLTVREAARLMGAPDTFQLPGGYNDGYRAMGDAVAAPVAEFLGRHLLVKLVEAAYV